ncbi:hypothetical protein [Delftia sp. PS-11]|uniref:hypothetical protein n=1 Tax=Delftia sp. PS-11 TaxID=2767222 RepID=UPI0024564D9F|nr:hypothetical protein [Delftia sp. PS-11]KAJ8741793.1 hypothetical protein H9T68_20745 [Delftia sp. PS-11]
MPTEPCRDIADTPSAAVLERARMLVGISKNLCLPLAGTASPELERAIEQVQAEQQNLAL